MNDMRLTKAERNEKFRERFAFSDETGAFTLTAVGCAMRWEGNDPNRTAQEDRFNDPQFMARYMSSRMIHEGDALSALLEQERDEEAEAMVASVRIIKHEQGNPDCPHCK